MNLQYTIFAALPGYQYPGFPDAIRCAVEFSGTQVLVLSDKDRGIGHHFDIAPHAARFAPFKRDYFQKFGNDELAWIRLNSLMRWFCVGSFCLHHGIESPIIAPDWDMLIFQDMVEAERRFELYDISVGLAALHIKHPSLLMAFYGMAMECLRKGKQAFSDIEHATFRRTGNATWSDMEIWEILVKRLGLHKVDACTIHSNTVFDDIIQTFKSDTQFALDGEDVHKFSQRTSKRIEWIDGKPHFLKEFDGSPVVANTIHCWGNYKLRTGELLEKAGL